MADESIAGLPADVTGLIEQAVSQYLLQVPPDVAADIAAAGMVKGVGGAIAGIFQILTKVAVKVGKGMNDLEQPFLPVLASFAAPMVAGAFGSDVDESAFADRSNRGGRNNAGRALVEAYVAALSGDADGPIDPSDEGAKRIAAASVNAALEGWFTAAVPEILSDVIPFDIGHFQAFSNLPRELQSALGIGRLVRRALTPLVNATATQPMTRFTNAKYRPTMLTPAEIAQQLARGNISLDDATRRLAEHGYNDDDIPAVLYQGVKFRAAADLEFLVRLGKVNRDDAITELQSAGWSADVAGALLDVEQYKRDAIFERAMADGAIVAYADGRIDESTLDKYISGSTIDARQSAQLGELADARKLFRAKPLAPAEAKLCVENDILAVQDYRDALDAAGYSEAAGDALELLLRKQLDDKKTAAQHKADLAAQKQAAADARATAAAAAKARIDAARALKQRGSIATLERAVVEGLIPVSRLEEVLGAEFDSDTVNIYVADVQAKRDAFVAAQTKAANAAKKASNAGLSIGQLQTALNDGVLTIDQITPQLEAKGLSADDVSVLEATMTATAAAKQAAATLRAAALKKASTKTLSLAQAEALTKAGHWTIDQFQTFARGLGYDDADVANLTGLVNDAIAKAKAAATIVANTSAADPGKGLTLAQFKTAVILGQKSLQDFGAFLTTQGYNADATATLIAEASDALSTAQAAQQRRAAAAGAADGSAVSLADVTRAAQLGIISSQQYVLELEARGYSADDAALELDLLNTEIAAKTKPTPAAGTAEATIAAGTGTPAQTAALKHVQVDGELAAKGVSLATTEKAVKDGLLTLDQYQSWLEANGYGQADAELLRALLASSLPDTSAGATTP